MELLAPAGSVETFSAALDAGADAVYLGAPGLNARNVAKEMSIEQLGLLIQLAHERDKRIYIALNSLLTENDLPLLIKTLTFLEAYNPDALIVQDFGVLNIVSKFFPTFSLHASTLMAAHNRAGVERLAELGFSKVVVARELTLKEIGALVRQSSVEIEIFIHGAMCFSYSGLCLFSSYLGGKSGLRGNCVQPCRRKYSISGPTKSKGREHSRTGYLFSMNDLSGLEAVPELLKSGVSTLKIEGRLRSATYVSNIVSAYRKMIDGGPTFDRTLYNEVTRQAKGALGRKNSSGFFHSPQPKAAISTFHSGNIGNYLGQVTAVAQQDGQLAITLKPKRSIKKGDRLRLHFDRSGKREGLTVKELQHAGNTIEKVEAGMSVLISLPGKIKASQFKGRIDVYLVDSKDTGNASQKITLTPEMQKNLSKDQVREIKRKASQLIKRLTTEASSPGNASFSPQNKRGKKQRNDCELWLRIDSYKQFFTSQPFVADRYVVNLDRKNSAAAGDIKRYLGRNMRSVIWALPPVINEPAFIRTKKEIDLLIKSGFRTFQISNLGQLELFENKAVHLYSDYTLNIMNSQALALLSNHAFQGAQLSLEMTKSAIHTCLKGFKINRIVNKKDTSGLKSIRIGMTVFGAPPLFISRIAGDQLPYGRRITSPKDEQFFIEKRQGYSITRPEKPFSLIPFRTELERMGLNYLVVDLSGLKPGRKLMQEVKDRLDKKSHCSKLPTFNYLGKLY